MPIAPSARGLLLGLALALLPCALPAAAAKLYPTDRCVSDKLRAAAEVCGAVLGAEVAFESHQDQSRLDGAFGKARVKLAKAWGRAEKRVAKQVDCAETTNASAVIAARDRGGRRRRRRRGERRPRSRERGRRALRGRPARGDARRLRGPVPRPEPAPPPAQLRPPAPASHRRLEHGAGRLPGGAPARSATAAPRRPTVPPSRTSSRSWSTTWWRSRPSRPPSTTRASRCITPEPGRRTWARSSSPICFARHAVRVLREARHRQQAGHLLPGRRRLLGLPHLLPSPTCKTSSAGPATTRTTPRPASPTSRTPTTRSRTGTSSSCPVLHRRHPLRRRQSTTTDSGNSRAPSSTTAAVNARVVEKWAREHFVIPEQVFVTGSSAGAYGASSNAPLAAWSTSGRRRSSRCSATPATASSPRTSW